MDDNFDSAEINLDESGYDGEEMRFRALEDSVAFLNSRITELERIIYSTRLHLKETESA